MSRSWLVAFFVMTVALPLWSQQPPTVPADARKKNADALAAARKLNDVPQQAMALLLLGLSDAAASDVAAARVHLQESAGLFETLGDHAGAWLAFVALAELEKGAMGYDAAVAAYERAVGVLAKAALPGEKFSIERLQSIGALFAGNAMPELPKGLPEALLKPIFMVFLDVMTRSGYGAALLEAGQLEKAETELLKAQQGSSSFAGFFDSQLAVHVGDLRRRQWRFDEARAAYRKALEGTGLLPMFEMQDDNVRMNILAKLADVEMLAGRTDDALAWNDQALVLARSSKNLRREASVLRARGGLLLRARRFDRALETLDEALKLSEGADADGLSGEVLVEMALINMMRGKYGTAAAQFERSIALFQKAEDLLGEANALILLSDLYFAMDLPSKAAAAATQSLELAQKGDSPVSRLAAELTLAVQNHLRGTGSADQLQAVLARLWSRPEVADLLWRPDVDVFSQLVCDATSPALPAAAGSLPLPPDLWPLVASMNDLLQGRSLIEKGDFVAARGALMKGLATNVNAEYAPAFLLLLGMAWAAEGNLDDAAEVLEEAAEILDVTIADFRVEEMMSAYLGSGRNVYFDVLVETWLQQGRIAEAFEVSERARARAFLQLIGNSRLGSRRDGTDAELVREAEALRTEIADWQRGDGSETNPRTRDSQLQAARERYELVLTRIKTSRAEYASITTVAPLSVSRIRAELPPDTTLITYFRTHWGLHAWLLDHATLQHVRLTQGRAAVELADCWAAEVGVRGVEPLAGPDRCTQRVSAEDVYRAVFLPLRERINTGRLLIVPHGSLHYAPFAALKSSDTGSYLVEDYTITYAPSASALGFLREKETPIDGTAIVFGDPATRDLTTLPFAEREAISVGKTLGTAPLVGDAAKESRLYRLEGKVDLVHIAAHGSYDRDNPLFSRIALAAGEGRDGNLEVHEILGELDLTGVNLVVLAACETAAGKRSGGDDVVGLTRALLYAGTPGVIAALWKVSDEATSELMREFYRRLFAGDDAADALRAAQVTMLRESKFATPSQWAAFALYGYPRGRWGIAGQTRSPQAEQ